MVLDLARHAGGGPAAYLAMTCEDLAAWHSSLTHWLKRTK